MMIAEYKVPVLCGIKTDKNKQVIFNWDADDEDDIIHLASDIAAKYDEDGVRYFYGYKYNPKASAAERKTVRQYLKDINGTSNIFDVNVEEFADNAVLKLDSAIPVSTFNVLVSPRSSYSNSLADLIANRFSQFVSPEQEWTDIQLVKAAYNDVEFDSERLRKILKFNYGREDEYIEREITFAENKFQDLKSSGELFQMKRFIPKGIRQGISYFLKFKNDKEEGLYNSLQGVDVLAFDDEITSKAAIKETARCLRSIHNENKLTVFALIEPCQDGGKGNG